jgi:prevent-host-death family protein
MDISVTDFKRCCLEVIRRVERSGKPIAITRRGKIVARLGPASPVTTRGSMRPWERLRRLGGTILAEPSESVLHDHDFEANR